MKKLFLFVLAQVSLLPAMQKKQPINENLLANLPIEIQEPIMSYVIGNTLNDAVNGVKRLYAAVPGLKKMLRPTKHFFLI